VECLRLQSYWEKTPLKIYTVKHFSAATVAVVDESE
jgi:hypothetical protein